MSAETEAIGARLRKVREDDPYWTRGELARMLRAEATPEELPRIAHVSSLKDMIKQWEAGKWLPRSRYRVLYSRLTGIPETELFGSSCSPLPVTEAAPGDYAATVRDTNGHLIALDCRYGGTFVADLALQAFDGARTVLASGRHDADERDLQAVTGETGEIAAWCLYDADRLAASRKVTHEAMLISRLAGDRGMELFQLSHLALLDVHQRRSREALRIAEHVVEDDGLAPRVAALFRIRASRALAQGGHRQRAFDSLDSAAGALQDSLHPRDPYWTWWLDASELAWHRGILHLELGEYRKALPYLTESAHGRLRSDPYGPKVESAAAQQGDWGRRAAYNDLVHLLMVLTMLRAWREAEAVMESVRDLAREISSARTEVMLRDVVAAVVRARTKGGGPSSTLLDLGEAIAAQSG